MHNPKPIKIAMVNKEINGEQLAALAKVSRPTVTKILNGKQVLPNKLEAVLAVLDLKAVDVYGYPPDGNAAYGGPFAPGTK